jgi:hypothetical protein
MTEPPEHVDVAARIAERLAAWHAGAEPGERTHYARITILGPAGQQVTRVELTYRQAEELAAWQAGVTSITCTPWATTTSGRQVLIDPAYRSAAHASRRRSTVGVWPTCSRTVRHRCAWSAKPRSAASRPRWASPASSRSSARATRTRFR